MKENEKFSAMNRIIVEYPSSDKENISHKIFYKSKEKVDFLPYIKTILQSIDASKNLLSHQDPEVLDLCIQHHGDKQLAQAVRHAKQAKQLTAGKFLRREMSQVSTHHRLPHFEFKCYTKLINDSFAMCLILPSEIPYNLAIYARN